LPHDEGFIGFDVLGPGRVAHMMFSCPAPKENKNAVPNTNNNLQVIWIKKRKKRMQTLGGPRSSAL
jgi:hypothetical protein